MNLGLRRDFTWRFVVAEVSKTIIGADFLAFYQLLVDVSHSRLLDGITGLSVLGCQAYEMSSHVKSVSGTSKYIELLKDYPSLTRPDGSFKEIPHFTDHHINTKRGPPVSCKSRRLAPDKMKIVKSEFETMLKMGIARRLERCWSSPLHLVAKNFADWRPCGDYLSLNDRTISDNYPPRNLLDCLAYLSGKTIFFNIDLSVQSDSDRTERQQENGHSYTI
ncbi:uncharacterized protein LOC129939715 [Eupeodes corollae]|uniref:uncharacterized protein LOC129939715 n=1 Tax=Eupeodes corollae TaxID=290404 RepID=UPI0024921327|nr:uncharacterized protein LOC129939715 [Eupeodes corollae]